MEIIHWFYDSWTKQQQYINDKSSISPSFSICSKSFIKDLNQVAFDVISQLRMTIPSEETKEQVRRQVLHGIQVRPLSSNTIFGMARQSSSRVSFE